MGSECQCALLISALHQVYSMIKSYQITLVISKSYIMVQFYVFIITHFFDRTCVCDKSLQSCLTFCDPMNCSLSGSSVHVIL